MKGRVFMDKKELLKLTQEELEKKKAELWAEFKERDNELIVVTCEFYDECIDLDDLKNYLDETMLETQRIYLNYHDVREVLEEKFNVV